MPGLNLPVGNVDFARVDGFSAPVTEGLIAAFFIRRDVNYGTNNLAAGFTQNKGRVLAGQMSFQAQYSTFARSGSSAYGTTVPDSAASVYSSYMLLRRPGAASNPQPANNVIICSNKPGVADVGAYLVYTIPGQNVIGINSGTTTTTSVSFAPNTWALLKIVRNGGALTVSNLTTGQSSNFGGTLQSGGGGQFCIAGYFPDYSTSLDMALMFGYNRVTTVSEDARILAYVNKYQANHGLT